MIVRLSRIAYWIVYAHDIPGAAYFLDLDGKWKQEERAELRVPFLVVEGPNIGDIAYHLQRLRDDFEGKRGTHYLKIRRCRWVSEKELNIALTAHEGHPPYPGGLPELSHVLLQYYEERGTTAGWHSEREILKAAAEAVTSDTDRAFIQDVAETLRLLEVEE